jgi:peptide/nickel transport system ATP-binding protein
VPNMLQIPTGCRFHNRCEKSMDICETQLPDVIEIEPEHLVRCWLYGQAHTEKEAAV